MLIKATEYVNPLWFKVLNLSSGSSPYEDSKWKQLLNAGFLPVEGTSRAPTESEREFFTAICEATNNQFTVDELTKAFCLSGKCIVSQRSLDEFTKLLQRHEVADVPSVSLSNDVEIYFDDLSLDVFVPSSLISEARAINSLSSRLTEEQMRSVSKTWQGDGYRVSTFTGKGSSDPDFKWLDGFTATTLLPTDVKDSKSHVLHTIDALHLINEGLKYVNKHNTVPHHSLSEGNTQLSPLDDVVRYARRKDLSVSLELLDRLARFIELAGLEFTVSQTNSSEFIIGASYSLVDLRGRATFSIASGVARVEFAGVTFTKPVTTPKTMSAFSLTNELLLIDFVMNAKLVMGLLYSVGMYVTEHSPESPLQIDRFVSEFYARLLCPYVIPSTSVCRGLKLNGRDS